MEVDQTRPPGKVPCENSRYAPVAQLDRVVASEAIGRGFESLRARQFGMNVGILDAVPIFVSATAFPGPATAPRTVIRSESTRMFSTARAANALGNLVPDLSASP